MADIPGQIPFWAQLGLAAIFLLGLGIVLYTLLVRKTWVPGWVYRQQQDETEFWKGKYFDLVNGTQEVAKAAVSHTVLTPEEADVALRIVRDSVRRESER